ncbi:hypothetical protein Mkiyose1665_59580 [Mycobacterium kiyosense]|uniref:Phosphoesterase n=1 Tax=Mycobacterium kiyosense TaxID=2871094 RepID=A0AA37QCR0_9MYCO|nr:hypothetical protein MKCMC460_59670 [Mycobacterium sp. 20KCMC460]GLB87014.1 hypothetical protein SRL2020028_62700 [Mycobacterium kiyosense]GLB99364.1 hypothetical protein SRL2020226_61400 [Mycobacterium kiyosense]GLD45458.1 hypothetical protein Mkiyose1665_59580 [Mycobacterium kiyosense]
MGWLGRLWLQALSRKSSSLWPHIECGCNDLLCRYLSSGEYNVDQLPFPRLTYVYNNSPTYLADHLLPLTQLHDDLLNPLTAPRFAWICGSEEANMEGPVSSPLDILNWATSQVTNHQYNIAAGDQYLQQYVSTIMNSPTWNSGSKDAIIITFDEDYNNLSTGIGNQGNHIPMIVIPNEAAVATGGMLSGHFVTNSYYNHYSLMSTIEYALSPTANQPLTTLTNNDLYATPMNDFWS